MAGASVLDGNIRVQAADRDVRLVLGEDCQITGSTGGVVIETPAPVAAETQE